MLTLPELGMKKPLNGSFNSIVDSFSVIVAKNPALAQKHGWPTNREDQENWIDQRECQRMMAHGWTQFVEMEGSLPPPGSTMGGKRRSSQGGAVAAVSSTLTGAAIWAEMFHGAEPVSLPIAEARAAVCAVCPENDKTGGFKDWFIATVARGLTEVVGMLNDKNLKTSRDSELGRCKACDCPMRAKVWVPKETILRHMPKPQFDKLAPICWITK
jgi:hypothetical protein